MPCFTTEQANALKAIVLNYLQGEAIGVTRVRLQSECMDIGKSCKSIYKLIRTESAEKDPFVVAILASLNIKKGKCQETQGPYEKLLAKSKNFHELLIHLYHDGHHQVGYLLRLIANTKPKTNWTLFFLLGAVSSAIVGVFFHFKRQWFDDAANWFVHTFPEVINWIGRTFSILRNIPLLGIIYTGFGMVWSWYHTFANGTTTSTKKVQALFFKTTTASFTMLAHFLSFLAGGTLTTPAALLFVLSSSIDVIKSVYRLVKHQQALKTLRVPDADASWAICAEYARANNVRQRSGQTVWIKLTAATLVLAAVVIWNFFPPNMVITVCCMSFIALIALTKRSIMNSINEHYANKLQREIKKIDAGHMPVLSHVHKKLSQKEYLLADKESKLRKQEQALSKWEASLLQREQAMEDAMTAVGKGLSSPAQALLGLQGGKKANLVTTTNLTAKPLAKVEPVQDDIEDLPHMGLRPGAHIQ